MYNQLTEQELITKWSNPESKLSVHDIADHDIKRGTAQILENISRYYKEKASVGSLLTEVASSVAPSSEATGQWSPISLALARRVTPDIFAWKCVGVQPMNGPVGLAYAMRFRYQGTNHEANFDNMNYWNTFTGNLSGTSGADNAGTGVSTATAEAWGIGNTTTPMPQLVYAMERVAITALTRKLGANISLETIMDVKSMHNVDVKREMVKKLHDQVVGEIDRELLASMKTQSTTTANGGEALTVWQTSAGDGRWQGEKYVTLINAIIHKGNDVGTSTRVAPANFAVVSPRVASVIQASPQGSPFYTPQTANSSVGSTALADIGSLNNQMKLYVDRYAVTDYALVGLKGDAQDVAGVIYSPYVMGLESEATTQEDFSPRMGVMYRYAITNSLLGAGRYYRQLYFPTITNITIV